MSSTDGKRGVPELKLERYLLDELPRAEREELELRLGQDESLRRRLEAIERSNRELSEQHPPVELARRITERLSAARQPRRPTLRRLWPAPAALAAAAVLVLVVLPQVTPGPTPVPSESGVRLKGLVPELELYRKTADGSETLSDGDHARSGDLLRVGYRSAGRPYGVIFSVDGRGVATLHHPRVGGRAAPLDSGGTVLLEQSYELDDAPRFERFYFVVGAEPFEIEPVVDAARRLAQSEVQCLELPKNLDQQVFNLLKGDAQ